MDNATRPREILIHQSANRPNTLLGADRELVLLAIMIAFGLGLSLATWWGVVVAALFWLGAVAVLQRLGKADPLLRQVYMRHIRYQSWYPSQERNLLCLNDHTSQMEVKTGRYQGDKCN